MEDQVIKHFENIRVAMTMGLQRGIFGDFETVVAVKQSMDAVAHFLKTHSAVAVLPYDPAAQMNGDSLQPANTVQPQT